MKLFKVFILLLLFLFQIITAWHVITHFTLDPIQNVILKIENYVNILFPVLIFIVALAVLQRNPTDFLLRIGIMALGAFLLLVFGLVPFNACNVTCGFLVNLFLTLIAPLPWILLIADNQHKSGLQIISVALLYGGLINFGYKLQYGPQIELFRWELAPAWGFWLGMVAFYLIQCYRLFNNESNISNKSNVCC